MKKRNTFNRTIITIFSTLFIAGAFYGCSRQSDLGEQLVKHDAILSEEFIYSEKEAQTPECHASTVAETDGRLVAAWFGGTKEKNKDVGIWVSRKTSEAWTTPIEVINGVQEDGTRYPCWNPVLFQPKAGPLMLFYKVGPDPKSWWGLVMTSADGGETWSTPHMLPKGILGPIKNKPVQLANGDILSPTSTEHDGWEVQIESSTDNGKTWTTSGSLNDGKKIGAIQPTLLTYADGQVQMLCRTENGFISECWSSDNGATWGAMTAMKLPNPNSGIDAATLADGRQLLVYNPTGGNWGDRVPLTVAISSDGKSWMDVFELESVTDPKTAKDEEYSYPGVIQASDGLVHIVYTWNRKTVKHVVVDTKMIN